MSRGETKKKTCTAKKQKEESTSFKHILQIELSQNKLKVHVAQHVAEYRLRGVIELYKQETIQRGLMISRHFHGHNLTALLPPNKTVPLIKKSEANEAERPNLHVNGMPNVTNVEVV